MHLVEIFLPLADNGGRPFGAEAFARVRRELTDRFGGVTLFARAPAHGTFAEDGGVRHDDIVVVEVMAEALDRDWWAAYRRRLERDFAQDEIVVRASEIERL